MHVVYSFGKFLFSPWFCTLFCLFSPKHILSYTLLVLFAVLTFSICDFHSFLNTSKISDEGMVSLWYDEEVIICMQTDHLQQEKYNKINLSHQNNHCVEYIFIDLFSIFQIYFLYSNDVQLIFSSYTFKVRMCFSVPEEIYLSCFNGNVW